MTKLIFAIVILFSALSANGQAYYFKHYQTDDGLSDNVVLCAAQDSQGFIWIGTSDGLNRFDGNNFKIFRNNPSDPASLGENNVRSLLNAYNGKLWVGTAHGLFTYNSQKESFVNEYPKSLWNIAQMAEAPSHTLWFITDDRLVSLNEAGHHFITYTNLGKDVTSVCVTPSGDVWASKNHGELFKYNSRTHRFDFQVQFEQTKTTHDNNVFRIKALDDQNILIGTWSAGVKIFHVTDRRFESLNLSENFQNDQLVKDILCTDNEIWVATENGIYVYNRQTKKTTHLTKDINNPYSLSDNFVSFIMKDRENSIWAGTFFGGLNIYSYKNSLFNKYYNSNSTYSLTGNILNNICQDKFGNIWISTADAGLNKLDPQTQKFTHIDIPASADAIPSNIPALMTDDNNLWIGSYNYGLYVMDIPSHRIIKHYQLSTGANGLKSNFIVCLYKSKAGKCYIGTNDDLYAYDKATNTFTPFFHDYIRSITEDGQGNIWVGTLHSGALKFNAANKLLQTFAHHDADKSTISSENVNTIFEDSEARMWFGTGNGLCRLTADGIHFQRYNFNVGQILNIMEDKNHLLWLSSKEGLLRFDPDNRIPTQLYMKSNGLISNQFNSASAFEDADGKMYFGSTKGIISFDPMMFHTDEPLPGVTITSFKVNNNDVPIGAKNSPLQQSVTQTRNITLSHDQSSFSFDFAALSYVAPKRIHYAYKMQGVYDSWTTLDVNRTVYFTDLKPGNYVFEVKAATGNGIWTPQPTLVHITILPPWWFSNTAYIIYFLLIALAIYILVRNYHRRAQEKLDLTFIRFEKEKEKEVYLAKIEFFTHITHEIRTPLTLIKGPLENALSVAGPADKSYTDLQLIKKSTKRLLDLTNQLLDFRKTESKSLNLIFTRIDLNELLNEVYHEFEPLIKAHNLHITFNLPNPHLHAEVDPEALHKIMSNLFTNAIKYAESKLIFNLIDAGENFILEVVNDGNLIPHHLKDRIFEPFYRLPEANNQQGSGIGLALCRSLAGLHNGTLTLSGKNAGLNTFILQLPTHQKNSILLENEPELYQVQAEGVTNGPQKPAILVVDDNHDIADFIRRTLSGQYLVDTAANGHEALQILRARNIQLVISDVMMPGMSGFELCNAIKNDLELSHIPVVLLTAKSTVQSKVEGLQSGADVYIEKPFSPEHLTAQVGSLLLNRETIKSHFANSPLVHIKNIAYSKSDEDFVGKLNTYILASIDDPNLDVNCLADKMNMSRTSLYRKIKAISNLSPNELITLARLKKAAELLSQDEYKIYEIAAMVGFNSQTYFGQSFLKQFNMTPKDYAQQKRKEKLSMN